MVGAMTHRCAPEQISCPRRMRSYELEYLDEKKRGVERESPVKMEAERARTNRGWTEM